MKLLVTGAKGQVGSALCRLGAGQGFDLVGLDSSALDIGNPSAIAAVMAQYQPDVLINAAAYTAVDKAESEPEKAKRVNGLAVGYLAKEAALRNIPLIHISTDYVFDGLKTSAYVEADAVNPLGVYGSSKLLGEQLAQQNHNRSIILRTSWVFGHEGNNFPKTMIKLAKQRPEIGVVADQHGCPTFADDIAKAIFMIISHPPAGGIYHYAGDSTCSWHEFADFIFNRALTHGIIPTKPKLNSLSTEQYPTLAKRPKNSALNCQKLMKTVDGMVLSDWRAAIDACVQKT